MNKDYRKIEKEMKNIHRIGRKKNKLSIKMSQKDRWEILKSECKKSELKRKEPFKWADVVQDNSDQRWRISKILTKEIR